MMKMHTVFTQLIPETTIGYFCVMDFHDTAELLSCSDLLAHKLDGAVHIQNL